MQPKTAKKGDLAAEVYSPQTVFFYWLLHLSTYVYVRNMYTNKYTRQKTKKKQPPEVRCRDGHVENVYKSSGSICWKRRGHLDFCADNTLPSSTAVHGGRYDTEYLVEEETSDVYLEPARIS